MSRTKLNIFLVAMLTLILIALDQLSKWQISQNLNLGQRLSVFEGIIGLTYVRNTGAAWSILAGHQVFFIVTTVIASIAIIYYLWKNFTKSKLLVISLILILSGAIGNLLDRVIHGFVIDLISLEFINFPIFNLADSYLTIGVLIFLIVFLLADQKNKTKKIP